MAYIYDIYEENCPTRQVLDRLADKWALLILDRVKHEPMRFNHLKRDIKGISQKALSQTLRKLERDGLVSRTVNPTLPVTVEYALTPLGETMRPVISALKSWGDAHVVCKNGAKYTQLPQAAEKAA